MFRQSNALTQRTPARSAKQGPAQIPCAAAPGLSQGSVEVDMGAPQPSATSGAPGGPVPLRPALAVAVAVLACSAYANLSFAVKDPADYRFFPPFRPFVNVNRNYELGGEYYQIARSLAAGEGFASPFKEPTGPTAWMPPLLPALTAGLLWACDGDRDAVMAVVIFFQVCVLTGTGFLLLALARQTAGRVGTWGAAAVY